MKRSMNTRIKVIFLIAVLLMQIANPIVLQVLPEAYAAQAEPPVAAPPAPDPAPPALAPPQVYSFGPFTQITHELSLDAGSDQLCERNLTGEITFQWPEPSTFVDVVFIQDLSGSFEDTIVDVGAAVKTMVNSLNMGKDVDNSSPKDRAMIVTYQGVEGRAVVGTITNETKVNYTDYNQYDTNYTFRTQSSGLQSEYAPLLSKIDEYYQKGQTDGGTPTVDGLVVAEAAYSDAITIPYYKYNDSKYKVTPASGGAQQSRQRKSVYILITDGAANTASWNNLPVAARQVFPQQINSPSDK